MQQQFQILQAAMNALAIQQVMIASTTKTKPAIDLPSREGSSSSPRDFLFQIETMKKDNFFTGAHWDHAIAGQEAQNNYLLVQIIDKVTLKHQSVLTEDSTVQDDGFTMLKLLIHHLNLDSVKRKLLAITELAPLECSASNDMASYTAKVRALANSLKNVS